MTIQPYSSAVVDVTIASLNGFQGTVTISLDFSPAVGLAAHLTTQPHLSLGAGGTIRTVMVISALTDAAPGIRVVAAFVQAGCVSKVIRVQVTVPPLSNTADFAVFSDPSTIAIGAGDSRISTVVVTSRNGFEGRVFLTTELTHAAYFNASVSPSNVALTSGSEAIAQLTVRTSRTACVGSYEILVRASSGQISHSSIWRLEIAEPASSGLDKQDTFFFGIQPGVLYGILAALSVATLAGAILTFKVKRPAS